MIFRRSTGRPRRDTPRRQAPISPERLRRRRLILTAWATWLPSALMLWGLRPSFYPLLAEGQKAPATLVAAVDFVCLDMAGTELLRRKAAESAPPVFTIGLTRRNEILRDLGKLFDQTARLRERHGDDPARLESALAEAIDLLGMSITPKEALALAPPENAAAALEALRETFRRTWSRGIVLPWDRESRFQGVAPSGQIIIEDPESGEHRTIEIRDLLIPAEAAEATVAEALARLDGVDIPEETLRRLWSPWMLPNLIFEPALSRQRREQAERQTPAALMTVPAGTLLIEAGDRADAQTVEMLRAHDRRIRERTPPHEHLRRGAGRAGLMALALMAVLGLLSRFCPETFDDRAPPALFATLSLLALGASRGLLHFSITSPTAAPAVMESALPLAVAPLTAAVLTSGPLATALGLWTSAAAAILADLRFHTLAYGALATAAAVLFARRIRSRGAIFRGGFGIAAVLVAGVLLSALGGQPSTGLLFRQCAAAAAGSLGSAAVALLLIPLFESALGFTTDIRLLELSDPGHPLLQRLAAEAPGTYHHSLMVANLAQAAADEIGANALLARVCAYYHDIGKLLQPAYFTENVRPDDHPHDRLSPRMSALVILSHVKDGVGLARQHRLPRPIVDAILQHHGTSLISFFYQRAQKQAGAAESPAESDFRYPGPLPHSREIAILALADAVEAASRSLDKPTPARIRRLVDDIAARKRDDGQFDHSALTFEEFHRVKNAMVFTLTNMLHRRVPYPPDHAHSDQQPTETPPDSAPPPDGPDSTVHDAHTGAES